MIPDGSMGMQKLIRVTKDKQVTQTKYTLNILYKIFFQNNEI